MSDTQLTPEPALPGLNAEALIAKAIEHAVPIETLERLLALRDKLKAESATGAFFSALSRFQTDCPIIPKTKTAKITSSAGSYTYSYAPLEVIVARVGPLLERHGLSYRFETNLEDRGDTTWQVATCLVHHVGGHAESSTFRAPIDAKARMNDMQKAASAVTYAKRYAFCNALGIVTGDEDDDGHLGGTQSECAASPEIIATLRADLLAADIPLQAVCQTYSVELLEELTPTMVIDARRRLDDHKRKRAAKA